MRHAVSLVKIRGPFPFYASRLQQERSAASTHTHRHLKDRISCQYFCIGSLVLKVGVNSYRHSHSHTHTHTHTRTHARTHARTHPRTLARTRSHAHTQTYLYTHTHAHTRTQARTHARTHALTHARTHAHRHTHTHTHTPHTPVSYTHLTLPTIRSV